MNVIQNIIFADNIFKQNVLFFFQIKKIFFNVIVYTLCGLRVFVDDRKARDGDGDGETAVSYTRLVAPSVNTVRGVCAGGDL